MSAAVNVLPHAKADVAIVLLGCGGVGRAFLSSIATPAARHAHLVGVANSTRQLSSARGLVASHAATRLLASDAVRDDDALLAALDASGASRRVIVDATASDDVAARHAAWLGAGYEVVSANKAAIGGSLADWRAIVAARQRGDVDYGDSATVGAGLPVISTLRRLHACGDRLIALEGVFSGSLSWLFNRFDGTRPFSALLREARAAGYTEPDPRIDLGGTDVARKLLILTRVAGIAIEDREIRIDNPVPPALRGIDTAAFLDRLHELDAPLEALRTAAQSRGRCLRFLARLDARFDQSDRARVGLVEVESTHPAARLAGTDNLFAVTTTRYAAQPLVIQGPGAGTEVTAQALLADVLSNGRKHRAVEKFELCSTTGA